MEDTMFGHFYQKPFKAYAFSIASALLVLTAGLASAEEPKKGGSLSVALETDQTTLDPLGFSSFVERQGGMVLYDTLLGMDGKGNIVAGIAEKIETSEDATSFKLTLRGGVKFADGTAYDAAAVVKNFQRIMDPKNKCKCASEVAAIDKVEATSPLEVTIHAKTPAANFPATLADIVGMVVSPTAVEKYGADFANYGVGAGPFKLKEWRRGDRVVLERNEFYWRGPVHLDEVVLRPIADTQTRYASLQAGNVDIIMNAAAKDVLDAERQKTLQVFNPGSLGTLFVQLNLKAPDVSDVRVRQALAYSLDREAYNKVINGGLYKIASTPFGSGLAPHEQVDGYPKYDLAKAKQLVADYGKPINIKLIVSSAPAAVLGGQALQQMWKKAGIETEIIPTEATQAIKMAFAHDYQAMAFRWAGGTDPDKNVYQFFHTGGAINLVNYSDPEMDKLLDAGRATVDPAARLKIYRQISDKLAKDLPYLFLNYFENIALASPSVKGLVSVPDGLLRLGPVWKEK
jgi:peptide/nickel transport system substrate-binding protein